MSTETHTPPSVVSNKPQPNQPSVDEKWTAVATRDRAADGSFVYSVETTGIYCRPSCPSRLPLRQNVRFHASPAAAVAAGYRACKRCAKDRRMEQACRWIEESEGALSLAELAGRVGLSAPHLQRVFKAATGISPKAYAAGLREKRARAALEKGTTVTEAIYEAGYQSTGRFYEAADNFLGMTPRNYRAGGAGTIIRFAVGVCSLGSVLVAQSDRGICAILLGDSAEDLERDLHQRFPKAELLPPDPAFQSHIAAVIEMVEQPRIALDLPLDIRGTAFQQRVWRALRQIPPGQTSSYAEVANSIGAPAASRAVAGACAANALAVAIPCHRVVRSDGALSGYRWGVERKKALLEKEARS